MSQHPFGQVMGVQVGTQSCVTDTASTPMFPILVVAIPTSFTFVDALRDTNDAVAVAQFPDPLNLAETRIAEEATSVTINCTAGPEPSRW
jgi:hypothetical protein